MLVFHCLIAAAALDFKMAPSVWKLNENGHGMLFGNGHKIDLAVLLPICVITLKTRQFAEGNPPHGKWPQCSNKSPKLSVFPCGW